MKKQLLGAFLTSLCALGVTQTVDARNAYAYDIKVDKSATEATVSYRLNTTAKAVKVQLVSEGAVCKEVEGTVKTDGANTVTVPLADLTAGKKYSFRVVASSENVTKPTIDATAFKLYAPHGIIVDANTESAHFGRIITTEAIAPNKAGYLSSTDGIGLYAFDPQLNSIKTKDGGLAFKGGLSLKAGKEGSTSYLDPKKIRLTEDGRIFVGRMGFDGTQNSIYEVNPDDLDADFTEFFKGTVNDKSEIVTADDKFMGAQVVSFDFKGSGDNLKMLVLSSNKAGAGFSYAGFRTDEYNVGTSKTWDKEPSANIDALTGQYTISATNATVTYDNDGGIWYCQYRSTPSGEQPALIHLNAQGVEDYQDIKTVCGGGGFKFNHDFSLVAIANKKANVGIYKITKGEDGKIALNLQYEFSTTIGTNCNDMAWDLANNLYIVGNSGEWLKVVALPRESEETAIDAASKYEFTAEAAVEYPAKLYAIGNTASPYGYWQADDTTYPIEAVEGSEGQYKGTVDLSSTYGVAYFAFTSTPGTSSGDWTTANANRYAPASGYTPVTMNTPVDIVKTTDANAGFSFSPIAADETKTIVVNIDLTTGKMTVTDNVGAEEVAADATAKVVGGNGEINVIGEASQIEVYTLGGALVSTGKANVKCAAGCYIVVVDKKATKVVVK